jgi:asparagine synthetase B (glutamine-hydrolysing)
MCGTAGQVTNTPSEPYFPAAEHTAEAMGHRGPDSWADRRSGWGMLVNARMAIADSIGRGRMHMSNSEGTVWITYNGEIYNAGDLCEQFVARGRHFVPATDSTVPASLCLRAMYLLLAGARIVLPQALWQDLTSREKRTSTFPFSQWMRPDTQATFEETVSPERFRASGILQAEAMHRFWQRFQKSLEALGRYRLCSLYVLSRWPDILDARA